MRVKTIHLTDDEGPGIKIGAITRAQLQKYFTFDGTTDEYGFPVSSIELLCDSLNNATKVEMGLDWRPDLSWVPGRVYEIFDIPAIKELIEKAMEYSAIKLVPKTADQPEGETQPAAE